MKQTPCHLASFTTRCREVGLTAWVSGADGALEPATGTSDIDAWFATPTIRDAAAQAWADVKQTKSTGPRSILSQAWLLPVTKAKPRGSAAVLALGTQAAETDWFDQACREAGLERGDVIAALENQLCYDEAQLEAVQRMMTWCYADQKKIAFDGRAIEEFSEKLVQSYEESQVLFKLARLLNVQENPRELMEGFVNQLASVMPFSWIAIAFGSHELIIEPLRTRMLVAGELPIPRSEFTAGAIRWIEQSGDDNWTQLLHPDSDAFAALVGSEIVIEPVSHDNHQIGALIAGGKVADDPELSSEETQFIDAAGDFLGVFHENIARFAEQHAMFLGTIHALSSSIDAKDPYTCGHSERVAYLSAMLARATGMSDAQADRVRVAGLLHDVGKIGVPEAVLSKNGRPTAEEFEIIKQHPVIGHKILKDIPPLADTLPGVLYHHERFDGRGYPEGLAGEDIPLLGRIIGVADTFDAMSSTRAYRAALPREKVIQEVKNCAGQQFDPALAELFVELDFTVYDEMLARHTAQGRSDFAA